MRLHIFIGKRRPIPRFTRTSYSQKVVNANLTFKINKLDPLMEKKLRRKISLLSHFSNLFRI